MSSHASVRLLKLKISLLSVGRVLLKPLYLLIALFFSMFIAGFLLWSLNLSLLRFIIFEAPLNLSEKADFFFSAYRSIFSTYNTLPGLGIIVFSVLFGVNVALIIFVIGHKKFDAIPKKSGVGGLIFAVIGGGCIACGTSLIAPLLATFGATSSTYLQTTSSLLSWLGSILILYSIYKLGEAASFILAGGKNVA